MNIILFDGVCNFCNASVQFIIRRDPRQRFRFGALQSEPGQALLKQHGITPTADLQSVVLIENGRLYTHSTAALRIARQLSGAWPLLYGFIIVPRPIRDWVYAFVARNRYRWFGKKEACSIPTPEQRALFI
jgi:predicted DCC family thiol-disulfide oxidoreductase YuxK